MQTGAQLLDERVPLQIREQALVTDNVHTSLLRKTPLNGCWSELQTFLSMEEKLHSLLFSRNHKPSWIRAKPEGLSEGLTLKESLVAEYASLSGDHTECDDYQLKNFLRHHQEDSINSCCLLRSDWSISCGHSSAS